MDLSTVTENGLVALLCDGDQVTFEPTFLTAVLIGPLTGTIKGTGHARIGTKAVCVCGDEASVKIENVAYTMSSYTGGFGTLTIDTLGATQISRYVSTGHSSDKKVLLSNGTFTATFTVDKKRQGKAPGVVPANDPTPSYSGEGRFFSTNTFAKSEPGS